MTVLECQNTFSHAQLFPSHVHGFNLFIYFTVANAMDHFTSLTKYIYLKRILNKYEEKFIN